MKPKTVTILGAGSLGAALGGLLQTAGYQVTLVGRKGTRTPLSARSEATASQAIRSSELVVLAVPFSVAAQAASQYREDVGERTLVDVTNPLNDDFTQLALGEGTSAGETIQGLFPQARVVKAFNTVFAATMAAGRQERRGGHRIAAFLAGDDPAAVHTVELLAEDAGFNPVIVGPLSYSRHLEAMAHVNIAVGFFRGRGSNIAMLYDIVPSDQ